MCRLSQYFSQIKLQLETVKLIGPIYDLGRCGEGAREHFLQAGEVRQGDREIHSRDHRQTSEHIKNVKSDKMV